MFFLTHGVYDILLILQYQVSTTVMDLVVVFALFVFISTFIRQNRLALLCFCVATVFSVNKDVYNISYAAVIHCLPKSSCSNIYRVLDIGPIWR